jgi:SNF2 family DNA or RNA helicase
VGLGKTIEAGLIWTELRARVDARRLLVVSPKMLCDKWQMELRNRFGVNAQIVDAAELAKELERPQKELREDSSRVGLRQPFRVNEPRLSDVIFTVDTLDEPETNFQWTSCNNKISAKAFITEGS